VVRDQQVVGLNPVHCTAECNPGKVFYTHVPLLPSSIIWYRPMGVDAAAREATTGLAESNGCLPLGLWLQSPAG